VFVTPKAYLRFSAHAVSDMDNEVGGWLIGKACQDPDTGQKFIVVEVILPALYTRQGSAFLTFTTESQIAMYEIMEENYPGKDLVGWYHTHPRMGIFLSGYDTWLHDNFFLQPWQVALVIEPHTALGGFFIRNENGALDPRRYYGFYELKNGKGQSVVNWQNMRRENKETPKHPKEDES